MVRLTATDVARRFSSVMNQVDAGEEIEIVRNGVPIAELRPATGRRTISAQRWRELLASAPAVDDDFASDVTRARAQVGPPDSAWPS
ncbi:type II toxin-antitoxin system prevent-host-death family antitoxin [Conexibacter sp. JD483]|uniref:type II toxin-antitoxin system Phd/YefM family antitoxin n=1 Tax=unclassified Conexibacter TaxID=2627773 RepID=UPI0027232D09|nr:MULTISPECIES: type II toxin-antitoxin system prevent-host-death family antitoxin [unclassified Conexibacter]MDO8189374.1 type II toxin-antitoxin system prevent-host-death family antitoxin [Conexibacter sp. CPCC 205706]MDO8201081.1 type II toxin-antitoxin system prevent-host-death family antitoxin [Conexibacter sp. CPCC 205762]MDR9372457.1 type II toxin-antitoxin system prevent-host-death family antitoxin [Conexibacter sp. JD483]